MNRAIWSAWMALLTVGLAVVLTLPMLRMGAEPGGVFAVEQLRISRKLRHVEPVAVRDAVADLLAPGFLLVDLGAVRARVLEMPHVSDVRVRRVYPGRIAIDIVESEVVARLEDGRLLAGDGREIPADALNVEPDVPVVVAVAEDREAVLAFYRWAQAELSGLGLDIVRLELGQGGGLELTLSDQVRVRVGIGGTEIWQPRWQRFILSHEELRLKAGQRPIAQIDLRYPNGMAVGWIGDSSGPAVAARRP
ncbi:MAG: FtsQ-type POTRA domain-containing protein [Xanthomonadales bacterium]|nr:FtsQ-type POTRA domain-containing protein [Xanthomonadales bacterium]